MQIGSWKITDTTIEWTGEGFNRFVIERDSLFDTINADDSGKDLYKWIVLATNEEWLTHDDLYDLNFAFTYAAGAANQEFDYDMFDRTVEYQFNILEEEEESEPE